jgi:predicted RNA binding protein YcfA (HicA-like mRNA interferase family)
MEARHLLKNMKDDGWYLGDTAGACRQYVHRARPGVVTVCVRYTDLLGPETERRATTPAETAPANAEPGIAVEPTRTGASAYSPDLSGCVATGTDETEVRSRMQEALVLHLKALR